MITAKIKIYILIFNKVTLKHDIVSLDKDILSIPSIDICEGMNLHNSLCQVFESYIDLSSMYMRYKLYDVSINNQELHISYLIMLPFGSRIKNCFLIPSSATQTNNENIKQILQLL